MKSAASATPGLLAAMASIGSPGAVTTASLGTGGLLVGGMVGGATGGAVAGGMLTAIGGGGAKDIVAGAGTGLVLGGSLGFAGEAGIIGAGRAAQYLKFRTMKNWKTFENEVSLHLTNKLGETVIQTQRGTQGFDSVSSAGRGANARLFINEAKNYAGAARSFSAVTTKFQRNLGWAREAIQKAGLSDPTKEALLRQLRSGAPIRLWGNGSRGTKFRPQDIESISRTTRSSVHTHWIP